MTGEIVTSAKDNDLLHHAEIMTLRQITSNLAVIAAELQANRADMVQIKIDTALIKERQAQSNDLKEKISQLESKVDILEARNIKQDGAYSFIALLKDFGPWFLSLLVLAWSLLGGKNIK